MLFRLDSGKIFAYLFESKMTVADFSRKCGLSQTAVTQALFEKKVRLPTVAKIAEAMNRDPDALIVKPNSIRD